MGEIIEKTLILLPKLTAGGTERSAVELANFIARDGKEVTILLMFKCNVFYKLHPNVKLIEPPDFRKKYGKILYLPILLFFLRRNIKKENPQVIFALGYILLTIISSLGISSKLIISWRSSPTRVRFPGNQILNEIYKFLYFIFRFRIDGIVAQTQYAKTIFQQKFRCPIQVVPNFLKEITSYNFERKNQIITVGRCVYEKGQHYLIEAFSKIKYKTWTLIVVGDGPKRKELEEQAKCLGIADRVIFTGFQKDVDYYMAQSKIFAFTSIVEGFPNGLIEAMANGLAPVSFNCIAGPSEIITDGYNGYLVDVGDIEQFVNCLNCLIEDKNILGKISLQALDSAKMYHVDLIGKKYIQFFEEC